MSPHSVNHLYLFSPFSRETMKRLASGMQLCPAWYKFTIVVQQLLPACSIARLAHPLK
jgi:hypothetical protein